MNESRGSERELGRAARLMMAALDGELAGDERAEWEALLNEDSELRAEWEGMSQLKEVTDTMELKNPPKEVWDDYQAGVYQKLERGVGWILLSLGAIVVLTWGAWEWVQALMADNELPGIVRWGILALVAGLVVLLVSVIRERLFVHKREPYKDVVR
ncbi:MAG: hypothetical protein ABFS14_12890 [Gemmatimonadota bacterium]